MDSGAFEEHMSDILQRIIADVIVWSDTNTYIGESGFGWESIMLANQMKDLIFGGQLIFHD